MVFEQRQFGQIQRTRLQHLVMSSLHLSKKVIDAVRSVTGDGEHHLHIPDLNDDDRALVSSCFDEGFVSSIGQKISQFESQLAQYTGAKHAIAMSSGTAALHMALLAAGVKPNDEVLLPALTFAASGHAILYCGAKPHFVESRENGFAINPDALHDYLDGIITFNDNGDAINKNTRQIVRAMMVVHIFGHIGDIDALKSIASKFNILLIEDAAEALGSWSGGIHAGLNGLVGTLSFNGNKTITSGGGGCVLTNDDDIAHLAKHLSTTAKTPHPYDYYHDQLGYNYRMPNLNAALGLSQMLRLPQFLDEKITLRDAYQHQFADLDECQFYIHSSQQLSNYWLQAIVLKDDDLNRRNQILEEAHNNGLFMRPIWRLLSDLPAFQDCPSMELPIATSLVNRTINLPSSCYLGRGPRKQS